MKDLQGNRRLENTMNQLDSIKHSFQQQNAPSSQAHMKYLPEYTMLDHKTSPNIFKRTEAKYVL